MGLLSVGGSIGGAVAGGAAMVAGAAGALGGALGLGGQPEMMTLNIKNGPPGTLSSVTFAVNPNSLIITKKPGSSASKSSSSGGKVGPNAASGAQKGLVAVTGTVMTGAQKTQGATQQPSGASNATIDIKGAILDSTQASSNNAVMDDISTLWACTLFDSTSGTTPPIVTVQWGSITWFDCLVTSFSAAIKLFKQDGTPIRADITLQLTEYISATPGQNPTSGAFGARESHTVVAGDSLASISYGAYGRADYWRAIALANGIDDPLRIATGTSLLIPPKDVAREMK